MDLDNSVIRDELASDEKFNSVRPKNFEDFFGGFRELGDGLGK